MIDEPTRGSTTFPDQLPEYNHVRDASIRGAGVGMVALISKGILDLGSIVVLARLLTPADFGLVAMAGILLNLLRIVGDWGLIMASTQRRDMTEDQLSTLFWINVVGGGVLALLAIACAPLLVVIFDEPRLNGATLGLSLTLVAIGVGAQHEAIMRRRMRYGYLHTLGIVSQAIGLVAGVASALLGMGFWSLIMLQVVARVVRTTLLWIGTRWRPGKPRRGIDVVRFLRYGSQLVPGQLLAHVSRSFGEIIVGAAAGVTELGIYRRAHGIVMLIEEVKQPLKAMMPASLSRLQDDAQDFLRFYLHALTMWSIVACGVIGFVTAEAPAIVNLLLGDQWLSAISLIRWIAPAGLASALGAATEWMLMPLGEMKRLLALRVLRVCSIGVGVLVGWRWGVVGIAAGYGIAACVSLVIELVYTTSGRGCPIWGLVGAFARPICAATSAGCVAYFVRTDGAVAAFLLELPLYIVVFVAVHSALPGGWQVMRRASRAIRATARLHTSS